MARKPKTLAVYAPNAMVDQFIHPISGARLCLLKDPESAESESYFIGWAGAWQKNLKTAFFDAVHGRGQAKAAFDIAKKSSPPTSKNIMRDWQCSRLYQWEYKMLLDRVNLPDKPELKNIGKEIIEDYDLDIKKLTVNFHPREYSWYDSNTHRIYVEHPQRYIFLHELAHAIDDQVNLNKWNDHGPSFVRTALHLYARYLGRRECDLVRSARAYGLAIAEKKDIPACRVH